MRLSPSAVHYVSGVTAGVVFSSQVFSTNNEVWVKILFALLLVISCIFYAKYPPLSNRERQQLREA